jgi:hypothetical protein
LLNYRFAGEPNITVAVDCDEHPKLCQHAGVAYFSVDDFDQEIPPEVKMWIRGRRESYAKSLGTPGLVESINRACGTERAHLGLLNEKVGRIEEADRLVQKFLGGQKKEEVIEEAKKIEGNGKSANGRH